MNTITYPFEIPEEEVLTLSKPTNNIWKLLLPTAIIFLLLFTGLLGLLIFICRKTEGKCFLAER